MPLPSKHPADPQLLHAPLRIAQELSKVGTDPTQLMLVGASCRDILHSTMGHDFPLRGTEDWDFGVAVATWDQYDKIAGSFPEAGTNGLRRRIAGHAVDLTPFGPIEDDHGLVIRPPVQHIDVFGFRDVYDKSDTLPLGNDLTVRIPQPQGYAALKMRAWIDRSQPGRGEYKDAVDIATAIVWFIASEEIETWLYEEDTDNVLLQAADFDPTLAATLHLSAQIQAHLSPSVAKELFRQWRQTNFELLRRNIRSHELPNWPTAKAQQRNLLTAIGQGRL